MPSKSAARVFRRLPSGATISTGVQIVPHLADSSGSLVLIFLIYCLGSLLSASISTESTIEKNHSCFSSSHAVRAWTFPYRGRKLPIRRTGSNRKLLMISMLILGNMTPGPDIGLWRKGCGLGDASGAGWRAPVWRKCEMTESFYIFAPEFLKQHTYESS